MSSRELLVLLAGLPDTSKFKVASEQTFRIVEYIGDGDDKGTLQLTPAVGRISADYRVVTEYVDWPHDRKMLARAVKELAAGRADGNDYQPDFGGLEEPLAAFMARREADAEAELRLKAKSHIRSGLYGYERR